VESKTFKSILIYFNNETIHLSETINSYALQDFDCDGIEEFSLMESRVDEILGERAYSGGDIPELLLDEVEEATRGQEELTFKYFFFEENFEERASEFVFFIKDNFPDLSLTVVDQEYEDWNSYWRQFYAPIDVSENIEVVPEWMKENRPAKRPFPVYIYPGMGFGTGNHETTFLCLKLYDEVSDKFISGMNAFDFGCGSGILGIAAIKKSQMNVRFCDIDRKALDNCLQNLELNFPDQDLSGTELILRERLTLDKKFNLIFANILAPVLKSEKETILSSMKENSYLIVSGILNGQVDEVLNEYLSLKMIKVLSKGDWSAILFGNQK